MSARRFGVAIEFAGRYTIERELGRGGTSTVSLARDRLTGRPVAVKVLRPDLAHAVGVRHFLREIRRTEQLHHPHIVRVLDSGEHNGSLYFVLPYFAGGTLRDRLRREKQIPVVDVIAIGRTIADALDYAHSQRLIHRDVKPENILLADGQPCLADFGIARALDRVSGDTSSSGLIRGTPHYMSPEQATGERDLDGRSDIYSLGCVLYELLAGVPAFIGATPQAVAAQRLVHPPRSLTVYRPSVPPALDEVIQRALCMAPADRFQTAAELSAALAAAALNIPPSPKPIPPSRMSAVRRIAAVSALSLIVAAATWVGIGRISAGASTQQIDTTRIVLLPIDYAGLAPGTADELLYDAFARWRGIDLVDPFQIADAVRQHGTMSSNEDARVVVASLGAGRYVRGRLTRVDDSLSLRAGLYGLGNSEPLIVVTVRVGRDQADGMPAYRRLADSLLLRGMPGDRPSTQRGDRSLAAIQAFGAGQRALDQWNLPSADSAFQASANYDGSYSRAHLWLAQVRAWRQMPRSSWSEPARRATAGAELGDRDRLLARALFHLSREEFDRACRAYNALRLQNDHDFAAWYGLGQCRTFDRVVVVDASSPSGWRFRSSYDQGLRAYERALELLPSLHSGLRGESFESLRELLLTRRDFLIYGYSITPDTSQFLGRVGLIGDTLAPIPYPWARITSGAPLYPPGFEHALAHQRNALRRIAGAWSIALPRSPGAKEALATSLEILGDPAAADTLRAARNLSTDRIRQTELAAAEVGVRIKFALPTRLSELRAARTLADSLLAANTSPSPEIARVLAPLAEMLGRCAQAIDLARHAAIAMSAPVAIPRHYAADAVEVRVRSALGCRAKPGAPDIVGLADQIRRDPNYFRAANRAIAEDVLLVAPTQLAFPPEHVAVSKLSEGRERSLIGVTDALLRGDSLTARGRLDGISRRHGDTAPWIDAAYPEARLWVALGDRARALALLRKALDGVRISEPRSFATAGWPGSLVRAMMLSAELEPTVGDGVSGASWAAAVSELWSSADEELRPLVRSLNISAQ